MDDFNNFNNQNQNPNEQDRQPHQNPYPPNYYSGQQTNGGGGQPGGPQQPYQWSFENMQKEAVAPPKKKNKGLRVFGALVAAIALVVMGSFAAYGVYVAATGNTIENILPPDFDDPGQDTASSLPQVALNDRPGGADTVTDGGLSNSEIFKKVSPSVVGVVSYLEMGNSYFGYFEGGETQGQGSGIIMSSDGYIITNEHVVEGASRVEVVLSNGETYGATIIGGDVQTDLAVIKIDAAGLPVAEFGNSDQLEVGERVVAIGNPGGLQFASSLTVGYVSALNRLLSTGEQGYALECIQTDAAINPGNSGGALINAYGQVIGINSAKIASTGFEGMGFAIPINDATPILQDIIQNGKVTGRAMLGIQALPVSPSEAQMNQTPMGLRVQVIEPESDLAAKGIQVGDIITHINNTPIYTTTGSADILKDFKPGDVVTLSLYRRDLRGKAGSFNVDIVLISS